MKKLSLLISATLLAYSSFGQIITTIAGNHIAGYSGDGGPATAARLDGPAHIAIDNHGNILFSEFNNNVIRKIDAAGIISTIAGTGTPGYSGDGGPATSAYLNGANGFISDNSGNLFFADEYNNVIRKIDASGIITTVAGDGGMGYGGDGGPATAAKLYHPTGVIIDGSGRILIADILNNRVRSVSTSGIITTIAGTGVAGYSGDGGPASAAELNNPGNFSIDSYGNLFVTDQQSQRIRKIDPSGIITTVAGSGVMGYGGDGSPATTADLHYPSMTAGDNSGNLCINDSYNNRIRMVNASGIISTIAGSSYAGYSGDGGPATAAELNQPWGITFDVCGNLYITDAFNHVVRKVTYFTSMPAITGPSSILAGSPISYSIAASGGTWTSSTSSVATVNPSTGVVTGIAGGVDTITYANMCGTATFVITVHSKNDGGGTTGVGSVGNEGIFTVIPNPSKGELTLSGSLSDAIGTTNGTLDIFDMTGRAVYSSELPINNGAINSHIVLNGNISNGVYIIKVRADNMNKAIRFSLSR